MSKEEKQFISEPEIYNCCMCKKELDLINTDVSIYFCCLKQLATCMSCARNLCPKCDKQRISKIHRRLLKAKATAKSKLIDDKLKTEASPQAKVNIPKESLILKRQKMMPTSHLTDNKLSQQSQKPFFSEKSSQTRETKQICMSCLQQTPQTSRAKTQSAQQFTICKYCLDSSRLYEQKLQKKVQSQIQQKKQKQKKQKEQKQQVKCVSCQVVVAKDSVVNWGDSSLGINFCKECYIAHMQEQKRKLSLLKQKDDKLRQIRQNRKEEKQKVKVEQQKIEDRQQNKMEQRFTDKKVSSKIQDYMIQHVDKNEHLSPKSSQKRQKITQPSLISVTIIQRSRTQDQRDLIRKFSNEEADQQLLDIQIGMKANQGQALIPNQLKKTLNKFSKGNKEENRFKEYDISDKHQNQFNQCKICKYLLLEKDGFWSNKNGISQNRNKLLTPNNNPQKTIKQQPPIFMCLNCIDTQLEVSKIQKLYKESQHKYF